jgi:hypothetical protein
MQQAIANMREFGRIGSGEIHRPLVRAMAMIRPLTEGLKLLSFFTAKLKKVRCRL